MKRVVLPAVILLAFAFGCRRTTPPPVTCPVRGKVLLDGKPLADGAVEFRALSEPSWTTLAEIQPDGTFSLSILHENRRIAGALPGAYRVTISFASRQEKDKRAPVVLEKTYTVGEGDNDFTFDVTSRDDR
jgi:hypothetical protein